jgi:hypothetical protein
VAIDSLRDSKGQEQAVKIKIIDKLSPEAANSSSSRVQEVGS